jgi:hypothetical protein
MSRLWLFILLLAPRVALVLVYSDSYYLQRAYHIFSFPFLGFLFLPLTTLVYASVLNEGQSLAGVGGLMLAITAVVDVGTIVSAAFHRRD